MLFYLIKLFLPAALVDPGHITIPLCDDPEVVGRGAAYGEWIWKTIIVLVYLLQKESLFSLVFASLMENARALGRLSPQLLSSSFTQPYVSFYLNKRIAK